MRLIPALVLLSLLPATASAWEVTFRDICRVEGSAGGVAVTVAYDPQDALYAIFLTRDGAPWPAAATFSIRFAGGAANTISTTRHVYGEDGGKTVAVIDTGFGNVLNGFEFNQTAHLGFDGAEAAAVPLDGAAPAIAEFRTCIAALAV